MDDNRILCLDGNANGEYVARGDLQTGDQFTANGTRYTVGTWPNGEVVGFSAS